MKQYCVYILTNSYNKALYIGVTNNLSRRIYEHKNKLTKGYTEKYNTYKLVYYEQIENIMSALDREKQLKNWHRKWKIDLITNFNPAWRDLSSEI